MITIHVSALEAKCKEIQRIGICNLFTIKYPPTPPILSLPPFLHAPCLPASLPPPHPRSPLLCLHSPSLYNLEKWRSAREKHSRKWTIMLLVPQYSLYYIYAVMCRANEVVFRIFMYLSYLYEFHNLDWFVLLSGSQNSTEVQIAHT